MERKRATSGQYLHASYETCQYLHTSIMSISFSVSFPTGYAMYYPPTPRLTRRIYRATFERGQTTESNTFCVFTEIVHATAIDFGNSCKLWAHCTYVVDGQLLINYPTKPIHCTRRLFSSAYFFPLLLRGCWFF